MICVVSVTSTRAMTKRRVVRVVEPEK